MRKRTALHDLTVGDLCPPNDDLPPVVEQDATLLHLLERLARGESLEPAYVVTKSRRLCGTVRVSNILAQLFPLQALGMEETPGSRHYAAAKVQDVMDLKPRYVIRDTTLAEAARIMMREKYNRLPVVDGRTCLRGEITASRVFAHYLQLRDHLDNDPLDLMLQA